VPPTQIQDGTVVGISSDDLALLYCPSITFISDWWMIVKLMYHILAFYQRIIKEAANIPATIEIVTHLCWENEGQ